MNFASNIYIAIEADDAVEAHDKIRKLVKGVERASSEHGFDTVPFASPPVPTRIYQPVLDAVEDGEPEALFDDKEDVLA